jgi:hypothetical protein
VQVPTGSDLTVNLAPPQITTSDPATGQQRLVTGAWSTVRSSDPAVLVPVPDPICPSRDDVLALLRGYSMSDAEAAHIAETATCHPSAPISLSAFRALKPGKVVLEATGACPGGSACGRFTITVQVA